MVRITSVVAIALLATACGGGTGASEDDSAAVTTTTIAPEAAPSTVAQSSVSEDDGSQPAPADVAGIGEGTATINGNTYVFGDTGFAALRCEPDMFGAFFVFLLQVDESGAEVPDGRLSLALLLEGSDPEELGQGNEANLSIDGQDWIANEEDVAERGIEAGSSQVDSYVIEGNTVSGTATFYEEESYYATTGGSTDPIVTAQGTFEVTCSGA